MGSSCYKPNSSQGGDGKPRVSVSINEMAGLPGIRQPGLFLARTVQLQRHHGAITDRPKNQADPWVSPETGLGNQKDVVMLTPLICIVSEESSSLEDLQRHLTQHGLQGVRSVRRTEALRFFEKVKPDLAIIYSR